MSENILSEHSGEINVNFLTKKEIKKLLKFTKKTNEEYREMLELILTEEEQGVYEDMCRDCVKDIKILEERLLVLEKEEILISKDKKIKSMGETMKQIWDLNDKGLLSTTDLRMLLDRVQNKYKLSPLKYFPK